MTELQDDISQSAQAPITVDVWSDIACPWCYVGKRRFEQAVKESGAQVEVRYHAFELDPKAAPADGRTEVDVLGLKFGSHDQARDALAQMTELAAAEGLTYDFDTLVPTTTVAAHRLLQHALAVGGSAAQVRVAEGLFRAHFTEGQDVGDAEVLAAVAEQAGLDGDAARAALADPATLTAVHHDEAEAQRLGIRGVPFYVLEGRYAINGAQGAGVFESALRKIVDERKGADDLNAVATK